MLKISHKLILANYYKDLPEYLEFFKAHPNDQDAIRVVLEMYAKDTHTGNIFPPVVQKDEIGRNLKTLKYSVTGDNNLLTPKILSDRVLLPFFREEGINLSEIPEINKELEDVLHGTDDELVAYLYKKLNSLYYRDNYLKIKERLLSLPPKTEPYNMKYAASRVVLRYIGNI